MTAEVMAQVERRYSRKVGDSFRRDREHLALFEELAMHEDLDSSLVAMDSNVSLAFEASAQGENVLEMNAPKSDDDWLVTISEVPPSPKPVQQNVVSNDNLSSIKTSRSLSRVAEPTMAPTRGNASLAKSPRPGLSIMPSKSPRPAFNTSMKSPRPTTTSINSRSSSSPRSTSTKSSSPRLFTSSIRSSSPSTTRSSSASRATIATATKASAVKSSSPTYSRASSISSSPGRRASTGTLNKGPLLGPSRSISVGSTKAFVRGASPSARSSSPARNSIGWSPSFVSNTKTRGTSPARSGFIGGTSPSQGNITSRKSSPTRSISSTTNRKFSPTQRNSSPATLESSSVMSSRAISITPESVGKPHNFANDFPTETPTNLRSFALIRGSSSPGSLISRSYDDPNNSRRQSASSTDFDGFLSKSHDRGPGFLSSSQLDIQDQSLDNNLNRSHDGGSKRSLDREPISFSKTSVFNAQPYPNRRASTGDHCIASRNVTVSEYGLDGRRISKGNKEMPQSPKVGHNLGRSTTLQQDPAFEISLTRRSSDPTASRSVSYNPSSGGFKPFMTNNSIPSFNMSISNSLHRKLHQVDGQPLHLVSPPCDDDETKACMERSSKADYRNTTKRIQMGFALKKEDVIAARLGGEVEAQSNSRELDSKSPRLTSLVVSQGPVKIYQGLGDMEDMGGNWCCGMEYQYRSFCKHHECGIYKNFHDALVAPNSKPAAKMNAEDAKDAEIENVIVDSSTAVVNRTEEMLSDAKKVDMECAYSMVKAKIQQLKCCQEEEKDSNLDPIVSEDGVERKKRPQEGSVQKEKGLFQTLPSSDPSEIIMMSPVSVCESETSEDALPVDDLAPASPPPGAKKNGHLRDVKVEVAIKKDFNWELDTLESPSRPLKSPDFFQVLQRHGEVAISRVQSFNASEYDEETEFIDCNNSDASQASHFHVAATKVHPSKSDSDDAHTSHIVALHGSKTAEDVASLELGPRSELEKAMDKGTAQRVEGENVQQKGSPRASKEDTPRVLDDSNVSKPEKSPIIPQKPGKLFPLVKSPKDGGYYKRDVSMMSSKTSSVSRISSTSATCIDLTRSVDTTCSAHSQYDNALWDDPNYSGRFGDPLVGIPYKSIATLPLPLPVEVRCMELPGAVSTEGVTIPDGDVKTPRYDDGLEKLVGFVRSTSVNAQKQRIVPSSEENSKMHSRENSFDYFVDFLDSQPDLNLDGCGLTDALVSAHREAKKLENSPGANNNLRFIKRLDSKLSNNSLISDKSFESRATDMSSDSSWESGKNRSQPLDAACQVMEQIVENANALSHGRHLSSFKFGQKKTSSDLEPGLVSPAESDYGPSPMWSKHSKELSNATSDSSQKSAKHYDLRIRQKKDLLPSRKKIKAGKAERSDEQLADGRVLPALKSTPGIIILSDNTTEDPKFPINSPPRESAADVGELNGNLWEAVQIMDEEQQLEAELTPPAPIEFTICDFTPTRTPARTPARTPSHASKASSHDSHHSHHSHCLGVMRSPSVASKASNKYLDSDDGELHMDFTVRQSHRSYCSCNIL